MDKTSLTVTLGHTGGKISPMIYVRQLTIDEANDLIDFPRVARLPEPRMSKEAGLKRPRSAIEDDNNLNDDADYAEPKQKKSKKKDKGDKHENAGKSDSSSTTASPSGDEMKDLLRRFYK